MATKKKSRGLDTAEVRVSRFLRQWEKNEHGDDTISITFTTTHGYLSVRVSADGSEFFFFDSLTVTDLREILSRLKKPPRQRDLKEAARKGQFQKGPVSRRFGTERVQGS